MSIKKAILILFAVLIMSGWVLGSAIQAGAETRNYKYYGWATSRMSNPIADVEGHAVGMTVTSLIYVFEDGEVASATSVSTGDMIKSAGSWNQYMTFNFIDGSSIIIKGQGTMESTASGAFGKSVIKNEFIKGTGRFDGIKGTAAGKMKYLPLEKGEVSPKVYGEGTWTYTLHSK